MLDLRVAGYSRKVARSELGSLGIDFLFVGANPAEDRSSAVRIAGATPATVELSLRDDSIEAAGVLLASLYETSELDHMIESYRGRLAIDITSLEHKVWAPLVATCLRLDRELVAFYAEPDDYVKSPEPLPGAIFDLSEAIRGIEPLPGFARVAPPGDEDGWFAPLLGFEGARLAHVMDQEEVDNRRTYPVIGFPGFRLEYPTYTYLGNREVLGTGHIHRRVEYASASNPFEAFHALERILSRTNGARLRVAPIGTKPHALGAVLFAIAHPAVVELIYDHPVRSRGRTHGVRLMHLYEVSDFFRGRHPT
ncbi:MAG TPA: hypothetical protein VGM70_01975 [Pseudolysinimonas sp.]|jgi:hypothetical protein